MPHRNPPLNQGGSPTQTGSPPLPPGIRGVNDDVTLGLQQETQLKSQQTTPILCISVKQHSVPQSESKQPVEPEQQALPKKKKNKEKTSEQSKIKKTPDTTDGLPEGPASPPLNPKKDSSDKVTPDMLIENLNELFNVWRAIIEKNDFGNTPDSGNSVMNLMSPELNNNRVFNWLKSIKLTSKLEYTYDNYITNYQYYNASDLLNCIPCIARECGVSGFFRTDTSYTLYDGTRCIRRRHKLPSELCAKGMDTLKDQIKKLFYDNFCLNNTIFQEIEKEIENSKESLDKINTVRFNEFLSDEKYETPDKIKELRKTNLMKGFSNYTDALEKKIEEIVKTKPTESEKGSDEKDETSLTPINLLDTLCESLKNARVAVKGITPQRCSSLKPEATINLSDLKNVSKANKDAPAEHPIYMDRSKTSRYLYYLAKILHYIDKNINKRSESKNIYDILNKYSKQISKLKPSFFSNATISNNQVKGVIQNAINTTRIYIEKTISISSDSK